MKVTLRVLGLALIPTLLRTPYGLAAQGLFQVELIHPQSDDQHHYVAFARTTNATVFGVVAPAEDVKGVMVNDRPGQLFPAELSPFGAAEGAKAVEFRATVQLEPQSKITIVVRGTDDRTTRVVLEPATQATLDRLRDLVRQQPNSARNRCRLGAALRDSGNLEEAVNELRASLEQNMSCVNTRVSLGLALVQLGRPEEGLREFAMATEAMPGFALAWLNLGLVHARFTRDSAAAVQCFKRYLELEPNSSIADKVRRYIESH